MPPALWALIGAVVLAALGGVGYLMVTKLEDPFRTLETFPTERYLGNYEAVLGGRFKGDFVVEAELGASFGEGRLFSFRDMETQRIAPVLVPPELNQINFVRGQNYLVEIEVGKGGVLYARNCRKM